MMRCLVALVLFALAIAGLTGPASAQVVMSPERAMQVLSDHEHFLLLQRDRLLAEERAVAQPIWIGSGRNAQVVDIGPLIEDVETVVFLAQLIGLDDAAVANLDPTLAALVELFGRDNLKSMAIGRVRTDLIAQSRSRRASVLADIDKQLEVTRGAFELALAQRDAERAKVEATGPGTPGNCPTVFGDSFGAVANAGIPGYNQEILGNVSLGACQAECVARDWCRSVDYERAVKTCFLQPVNGCDVPLNTKYAGNPYDHYYREALD